MRNRFVAFALFAAGCATPQPLPPNGELEAPPERTHAAPLGVPTVPLEPDPLAAAFDAPHPATPPVASTPTQAPPAPAREVSAEQEALEAALREASAQLRSGAPEAAASVLASVSEPPDAEPAQLRALHELRFQVALRRQDEAGARRAAEDWLRSCGPDRVDGCRRASLSALTRASTDKGKARARERVQKLRQHDACVQAAERRGRGAPPACLDAALAAYRRMGDRLMSARVQAARGARLAQEDASLGQAITRLRQAESLCQERRCSAIRRRALQRLTAVYTKLQRWNEAASAALKDMAVARALLPPSERLYARTPEVERACRQLDEAQGAGRCRQLERALLGGYTFKDFSRNRQRQEGLNGVQVKAVNEHYGITLQRCLEAEAEKLVPPAAVTYRVRWMVTNEGRVEQARLERSDRNDSPFGDCLRAQLRLWRYPSFTGEWQHVEQAFVLHARERR